MNRHDFRRRLPALAAALLLFPGTVRWAGAGDWVLADEGDRAELNSGAVYVKRQLARQSDGRTVTAQLVFFSSKQFSLEVIDLGETGRGYDSTRDAFLRNGCIAGCTGGFFHPDHRPLGLMIADGKRVHQFQSSKLLSGVIYADERGIHLVRRSQFRDHSGITALLQTGPYLVEHGNPTRGLHDGDPRKRTFIATDWNYHWVLGTTSPLSLAELGDLLGSGGAILTGWRVDRAINLDGGSSTTLFVDRPDARDVDLRPWKRVRNLIGIRPK